MRRLLTVDNPADEKLLRRKAKRVENVQSTEVVLGIQAMKQVAHEWEHKTGNRCEGLAAAQIGWNARVIILRKSDQMSPAKPSPGDFTNADSEFDQAGYSEALASYREWMRCFANVYDPWFVLINTTIKQTEGEQKSIESCLSVPMGAYEVVRPTHVAFKFQMPNGKFSGVHLAKNDNAVKLMHEQDHNEGRLICDSGVPLVGQNAEAL